MGLERALFNPAALSLYSSGALFKVSLTTWHWDFIWPSSQGSDTHLRHHSCLVLSSPHPRLPILCPCPLPLHTCARAFRTILLSLPPAIISLLVVASPRSCLPFHLGTWAFSGVSSGWALHTPTPLPNQGSDTHSCFALSSLILASPLCSLCLSTLARARSERSS